MTPSAAPAAAAAPANGAAPERLGRRAARGTAWVAAGYGAGQALRFASNLVLARLLFPGAFGLMLLVNICVQGLQLFSDIGVGASIVQHERSDRAFLDTAWTLQALRGLALWLATFALAWPVAALYGEPRLAWMLPVAGLSALFDGLVSTNVHTANRDLRMGRLQAVELCTQAGAVAVTVALAFATRSVWALVSGLVAGSVLRAALGHVLLPGERNRPRWEPAAASSLLHFGKWVFASSIVTFLAQQGDRLVFGKMLPLSRLGLYHVALTLCEVPSTLVQVVSFRIFFPMFSELRRSGPDVGAAWRRASAALALPGGAGAIALVVAGPALVHLLYDDRYAEAGPILRLLALGIWGSCLVHFTAAVVLASGRVKWLAAANALRLAWLAATVPLAFTRLGFGAAIAAVVLADLPRYAALGLACRRDGLHIFRGDLARTAALAASAAVGILASRAMGPGAPWPAAVGCAAGFAAWAVANLEAARWYAAKARGALASRRASRGRAGDLPGRA